MELGSLLIFARDFRCCVCSGEKGPYSTSVSSVWLAMQESVVQMAGVQGVMSRLNYSVTALAFAMSGALAWQGQPQVWQSWARNYALLAWIHYSNAMCHPNIMNHPVAFDNIVRVSKLPARGAGEFCDEISENHGY
ncbi:hypothetical protein HAX54_025151 [Datura stramonium]|uniref:Uncharacterized protein n=1 Tax=Datura stramonium TaxID=4076 RepID=A0ABS8S5X5_DATST|nr:hypothetical protein [Datura stramonium]